MNNDSVKAVAWFDMLNHGSLRMAKTHTEMFENDCFSSMHNIFIGHTFFLLKKFKNVS